MENIEKSTNMGMFSLQLSKKDYYLLRNGSRWIFVNRKTLVRTHTFSKKRVIKDDQRYYYVFR